jgi:hypothetical protein
VGWHASWPVRPYAYRPFDSTDAAVADKGAIELEFGPVGYVVDPDERFLVAPEFRFNYGVTDRWEVLLEGRYFGASIGVGAFGARTIADLFQWPTRVSSNAIALAFGCSAAVGIFFGYYPARQAARLDPIDALRFE